MAKRKPPIERKITVECAVMVEVVTMYDPIYDTAQIIEVRPDWARLEIGPSYFAPNLRLTNVGISDGVRRAIERGLPRWCELRYNPPPR